jgi:predicted ATPase
MIKKWTIGNFKSINKAIELDIAPLTLLVGPNSSGKSTVLQSILLIAQTLASKRTDRQLSLNGEFVHLGSFDDLQHLSTAINGRVLKNPYFTIGFELERPNKMDESIIMAENIPVKVKMIAKFARYSTNQPQHAELYPQITSLNISVDYLVSEFSEKQTNSDYTARASFRLTRRKTIVDTAINSLIEDQKISKDNIVLHPRMLGSYVGAQSGGIYRGPIPIPRTVSRYGTSRRQMGNLIPVGIQLNHFLPNRLLSYYNTREVEIRSSLDQFLNYLRMPRQESFEMLKSEETNAFLIKYFSKKNLPMLDSEVSQWLRNLKIDDRRKFYLDMTNFRDEWIDQRISEVKPVLGITTTLLPSPFDDAIDWINSFFSKSIKYLGPLREEPRAIYAIPPSGDPADIGLKGEYTAAVLNTNKNVMVTYWNPTQNKILKETLNEAVGKWLQYFGLANTIYTQEIGKLGHILTLDESNVPKTLDLTSVGFGISQVLPILVMALLADEGATLIYEQPEIHLHPKLQADIADFFMGLILCDKRCIIETHSEYLVNRIRRRLAEEKDENILSKTKILFSQRQGSESNFKPIDVNKYGAVLNWPKGFFDQAQLESQKILEAAMQKRGVAHA